MTKETVERIVKGITDKIEANTADMNGWAEFWGFTVDEYEEFLDVAVKTLEKEPCEDAISRADAVKVASGYCHPTNMAKELAKLPPVTPTQRWIPVGERLPEEGQRVFVTQIVRDRTVVYCTTFPFEKIKEKYITAWMPLPKPYEPQESEKKKIEKVALKDIEIIQGETIPLDKVKQAREEIENRVTYDGIYIDRADVLEILDKLIESEE